MNTVNDGGPAFPTLAAGYDLPEPGMSLRAWLAGQALAGLCANPSIHAPNPQAGWHLVNCKVEDLAGYAAHLADATLAALGTPK